MPFNVPRASKAALGVMYSGLALAGVWFLVEPSQLLHTGMGTVVYGWAMFLVAGSTLCLAGIVTRLWIGEFTGLVLLLFGNLAWAAVLIGAATTPGASTTSAKYGLVLIALSSGAFAYRWGEIRDKVRDAAAVERHKRRRRGRGGI